MIAVSPLEYLGLAATAWFAGFFPLTEILVAVPVALATPLDVVSAVVWPVLGNVTPLFLILGGHAGLRRRPRAARWLDRVRSARTERLLARYGVWIVLVITPFLGVWATAVAALIQGMNPRRLIAAASVSITFYAVAIALVLTRFTGLG